MFIEEIIEEINGWIEDIKADRRWSYEDAIVQVNAPLALQQVSMKSRVEAYERVVKMLEGNK